MRSHRGISDLMRRTPAPLGLVPATALIAFTLSCGGTSDAIKDPAPYISNFTVSPTSLQTGTTTPITFTANFAVKDGTAVISPGNYTVESGVALNVPAPAATTTYTLTVTSGTGKQATATATVGTIGMTTSLDTLGRAVSGSTGNTASAPTATGRTFLWSITNGTITSGDVTADQITFSADTNTAASVSLACKVTDTGNVVTNLSKSFQIFAPVSFGTAPYSIKLGQTAVLSYTADSTVTQVVLKDASNTTIATKDTTTAKTGTINVTPAVTQTYTATTTPSYSYQVPVTVTVTPSDPATIASFTATPAIVTIDAAKVQAQQASTATSNLAWTLGGDPATSLTLNGTNVLGSASTTVTPRNRQAFTLVSGNDNPISDSKTIKVGARGLDLLAGSMGGTGMRDGAAALASFQRPQNLCVAGNLLYVADTSNNTIRKVDLTTNQVTTVAGIAGIQGNANVSNGDPLTATFNSPRGVAADAQGYVWVADGGNNVIRVISPDNKYVYTVSGWTSTTGTPQHLVVKNDGTTCTAYVATFNGTLLQLNITGLGSTTTAPAATLAKTFIINGTATATNNSVASCALDTTAAKTVIFVPDSANKKIKACYLDGSGNPQVADVTPTTPTLVGPTAVAVTVSGNTATVFASDKHFVFRYNVDLTNVPTSGPTVAAGTPVVVGTTTAGFAEGAGNVAGFGGPQGLALSGTTLYVAEGGYQWVSNPNTYSNCIRAIAAATTATDNTGMTVSTYAGTNRWGVQSVKVPATGTSTGAAARFKTPGNLAVDQNGNSYLIDSGNSRIVMIAPDGTTSNWPSDAATWSTPLAVVPDNASSSNIYVIESGSTTIKKFAPGSATPTTITLSATLGTGVKQAVYYKVGTSECIYTVDGTGKTLKRVDLATGTVTTNAYATTSSGYFGVAVDASTGTLYVSEGSQISAFTFNATTSTAPVALAGTNTGTINGFVDGPGASALFYQPGLLAFYKDGSQGYIYVVDARNSAIRLITLGGSNTVSTLIGRWNGTASTNSPYYMSALLGTMPGLLETDTTASTKALAGSITVSTLTTQGLAVNPVTGDLVITSCDSVMQLTAPLNK